VPYDLKTLSYPKEGGSESALKKEAGRKVSAGTRRRRGSEHPIREWVESPVKRKKVRRGPQAIQGG